MTYWGNCLFALTLVSASISAEEVLSVQAEESISQHTVERCKGPHHQWASVRYTTPEGIGFKTGYTTLEGFFTPKSLPKDTWVPFLNLRGHVFDDGNLAANAGLGLRYIVHSRVLGVNAYYDYRNTDRQHYNQVAAGFESLGRIWDFRINGYLPVGRKQSSFSHPQFVAFKGHSLLIRRKRDFAMKGANAEVGVHVDHYEKAPFYFAGGPYYLTGVGESTWGGEFRAAVDVGRRYLRIEGSVSYDHFFKWVGTGQVSINIPFGKRWKIKKEGDPSCSKTATLYARALQRVDRFEIIPVGKQKSTSRAINPETDQPWVFWFVDNTSSSAGTFADPFPTLLDAQIVSSANQGIYVFPGDGTTRGMNSGIILKNGQIFLGAGVSQTIATTAGNVVVPPLASSLPNITNTTGNVVTLANNNTVSGFSVLLQNGHGLEGIGISNLFASQNTFVTSSPNFDGINLINPSGLVFISDSSFSGFSCTNGGNNGNGIYVELDAGSSLAFVNVTGSQFSNISDPSNGNGGSGIFFNINGGSLNTAFVSDCNFNNVTNMAAGVFFNMTAGSTLTSSVLNCNFNNLVADAFGILVSIGGGSFGPVSVSNCNFSNLTGTSIGVGSVVNSGTIDNLNITNCSFDNLNSSRSIYTETDSGVLGNLTISNCVCSNASGFDSTIETEVLGGIIDNVSLFNNIFENMNLQPTASVCFTQMFAGGKINNMSVSGNSFSTLSSTNFLVFSQPGFSGDLSLQVLNNTFAGSSNITTGYAASIEMSSGTLCLEFIGNSASPASNPIPYVFSNTGATFNRTAGSDNTTNIGQFQITGAVGGPGSCSE